MKTVKLLSNFSILSMGTRLGEDVSGDYFVRTNDQDLIDSPLSYNRINITGSFVKANPHLFQLIEGEQTKTELLTQALSELHRDKEKNQMVIDLLNLAIVAE